MERLAAQAQTLDQGLVAAGVRLLQIGQQAATLVDHLEQATARVVILVVLGEVLGKMLDACRKQGDLDFRRAGIAGSATVIGNDLAGLFGGKRHDCSPLLLRTAWISPVRWTSATRVMIRDDSRDGKSRLL